MIIEEINRERFITILEDLVLDAVIRSNPKEQAAIYTNIMDTARVFGLEQQTEETAQQIAKREGSSELWELPESFEKPIDLQGFPTSSLPTVLSDYLKEVSRTVQVTPDMCALPLISTLSLCVTGKACIQFPGNDHTEPLNLYTVTVASPGQRKSSAYNCFTIPVSDYVKRYNAMHNTDIQSNKAERAAIKKQIDKEINSKNFDISKVRELNEELNKLGELHELRMIVKDITPEALALELFLQNERIGILDDEGSIFDVLGGLYSGGQANLGIFLEAYDGSPYSILRRTKDPITLNNPLLTMGLMTQPEHFTDILSNKQFSGRGLIHRFLFAFPSSKTGFQTLSTGNIVSSIKNNYIQLVNRLLAMPYPEPEESTPIIECNTSASTVLTDYFDLLQQKMRPGGMFENMVEWAAKHFARCMRIAAILHLCEHSIIENLNEQTAINAISISLWAENQALKALSGEMNDSQEVKDAKYILSRVKCKGITELSKRELLRLCQRFDSQEELEASLELLEDMKVIKRTTYQKVKGRPSERIKFNPIAFLS